MDNPDNIAVKNFMLSDEINFVVIKNSLANQKIYLFDHIKKRNKNEVEYTYNFRILCTYFRSSPEVITPNLAARRSTIEGIFKKSIC